MQDKLQSLLDLLKEMPNEPFVLFALAQECVKREMQTEAVRYYERIVASTPEYTGVYYHLGKLYEQLGKTEEAVRIYEHGMQITRAKGESHAYGELQSALAMAQ